MIVTQEHSGKQDHLVQYVKAYHQSLGEVRTSFLTSFEHVRMGQDELEWEGMGYTLGTGVAAALKISILHFRCCDMICCLLERQLSIHFLHLINLKDR